MAPVPHVGSPGLSLARSQLSCVIPGRMGPLGKVRPSNGLKGTVPAVPMGQELSGKGSGWQQDLLHVTGATAGT